VADLHDGDGTDLGSRAGADVFISARRREGRAGRRSPVHTDEMLKRRAPTRRGRRRECRVPQGLLRDIRLSDGSVDEVISSSGINLAADKHRVLADAARVLRPRGRFAVSDVIAGPDIDAATRLM
jgi:arsenite methyltransferase